MKGKFSPFFNILPPAQQVLWPELSGTINLDFVLYGGTALALRLGHRQSIDFDFFSEKPLDYKKISEVFPFIQRASVLQASDDTYTLQVPAMEDSVKISFFGCIDFGRVANPDLTEDENLWVASSLDLLGTKLKVILQRVESKDYIDVAALIQTGISLAQGLAAASTLFGKVFSPIDCLRALEYFDTPELSRLPVSVKKTLKLAVQDVLSIGKLPEIPVVSKSLLL